MSDIKVDSQGYADYGEGTSENELRLAEIRKIIKAEVIAHYEKLLAEHKDNVSDVVSGIEETADKAVLDAIRAVNIAQDTAEITDRELEGVKSGLANKLNKTDIENSLGSDNPEKVLSAPQGKILNENLSDHTDKHPFKRDTNNGGVVQTAPDGTTKNVAAKGSVATGEGCSAWSGNSKVGGKDTHTTTHPKLAEPPNPTFVDAFGEGLRAYFPHMFMRGKFNRRDVTDALAEVIGAGDDVNHQKDIRQLDWLGNLWSMGHIFTGGIGLDDKDAFDNTQAILDLMEKQVTFYIKRLAPGDRFEIPVNSMFFFTAGNNKIVNFTAKDKNNSDVTAKMTSGLCFAFETNKTADTYWTDEQLKNYYRLFIGYGTGSVLFSSAFDSYQDIINRGATINNTSEDKNVWLWVIQKGSV